MREHKFRARWKDTGEIILDFMEEYIIDTLNTRSMFIDEYTGLEDINEQEIYESDIIKTKESDDIYEVIFYMGAFRSATLPNKIRVYDIGIHHIHGLEVIGNIYENKELLAWVEKLQQKKDINTC